MKMIRLIACAIFATSLLAGIAYADELAAEQNSSMQLTISSTCNHQWSDWIVTEDATCGSTGTHYRYCEKCGQSQSGTIPATNEHNWSDMQVDEATCGEDGRIYRYCYSCGLNDVKSVIPATGDHDWDYWEEIEEPTCTSEGRSWRECCDCGATQEMTEPKLAHDWSDWEVVKTATKFHAGKKVRTCYECESRQKKVIPMKAMTKTDKKSITALESFFKHLKSYNIKKMKKFYTSKTKDMAGGSLGKVFKKQFGKSFEYSIQGVSSSKSTAKIKVKVKYPYAENRFYSAYTSWYSWVLVNYYNVSEDQIQKNLMKRLIKAAKKASADKETATVTIKMKNEKGKWKVVGTTFVKNMLDCGYKNANDEFRLNYLS